MVKYFIKKGLKRAACFDTSPSNIGTTEQDYADGKWVKISKKQSGFYAENPHASFSEIMNMEMKEAVVPEISIEEQYKMLVVSKIRAEYDIDDELAIQRKRDEDASTFLKYHNYCEQCKADAKQELETINYEKL